MLEPARSEQAPKWILFYVFVNALDEIKAIVLKRHVTDHIHHVATGIGFSIDYLYGSHRTQVLCQMGYVGEAVAPFYQVTHSKETHGSTVFLTHCDPSFRRMNYSSTKTCTRAGWRDGSF